MRFSPDAHDGRDPVFKIYAESKGAGSHGTLYRLRLLERVARAVVDLVANPLAKGVCLLDSAYIQRQAGRSFRGDPRAPSLNPNVC